MKNFKNFGIELTKITMISLLIIAIPSAQAAKGGGGKVTVTAATPSDALQGEELDIIVSGSGFDYGSTASYLVTGTKDDTQIEVLSNEYNPSTGQLKTRIRVNGSATVIDYDIQVTNSRGRRGKGTTLFKVQQAEDTCTNASKEPTIDFLTHGNPGGTLETRDLMLSSSTGCDQYLLSQAQHRRIP